MPSFVSVLLIVLVVFAVFVVLGTLSIYKKTKGPRGIDALIEEIFGSVPEECEKKGSFDELRKKDPHFHEAHILVFVTSMFSQYQSAIRDRDWRALRIFMDEPLFRDHYRLIRNLLRKKIIIQMEMVEVPKVQLTSYTEDMTSEYLHMCFSVNMNNRLIDERSGHPMEGYIPSGRFACALVFKRALGTKSHHADNISLTCCPSCGKCLCVAADGICSVCHHDIRQLQRGWILHELSVSPESAEIAPVGEKDLTIGIEGRLFSHL
jgi:hypothetical protein